MDHQTCGARMRPPASESTRYPVPVSRSSSTASAITTEHRLHVSAPRPEGSAYAATLTPYFVVGYSGFGSGRRNNESACSGNHASRDQRRCPYNDSCLCDSTPMLGDPALRSPAQPRRIRSIYRIISGNCPLRLAMRCSTRRTSARLRPGTRTGRCTFTRIPVATG